MPVVLPHDKVSPQGRSEKDNITQFSNWSRTNQVRLGRIPPQKAAFTTASAASPQPSSKRATSASMRAAIPSAAKASRIARRWREVVGAKGVMQQFADLRAYIVVSRPRHKRGDERR